MHPVTPPAAPHPLPRACTPKVRHLGDLLSLSIRSSHQTKTHLFSIPLLILELEILVMNTVRVANSSRALLTHRSLCTFRPIAFKLATSRSFTSQKTARHFGQDKTSQLRKMSSSSAPTGLRFSESQCPLPTLI